MAVKGSIVKNQVIEQLLKTFEGSFSPDGKEVRIDMVENGNPVQLKVAITAVKVPISQQPKIEVQKDFPEFFISEEERTEMQDTLKELGVKF